MSVYAHIAVIIGRLTLHIILNNHMWVMWKEFTEGSVISTIKSFYLSSKWNYVVASKILFPSFSLLNSLPPSLFLRVFLILFISLLFLPPSLYPSFILFLPLSLNLFTFHFFLPPSLSRSPSLHLSFFFFLLLFSCNLVTHMNF